MNTNAVAKNYGSLTPEERFRLIVAAAARGDEAEQARLAHAGQRITLTMQDHAPHAYAFQEVALLTFIELMEEAARYSDAFACADDGRDIFGADESESEEADAEEEPDAKADVGPAEDDAGERPVRQRTFDMVLAAGFMLKTKADGWKLFCERLNVSPCLLWTRLSGFDRLQHCLALAEKAAFVPEGFLRWLNAIRPAGEPERTELPFTVEGVADAATKMFRDRAEWWGG